MFKNYIPRKDGEFDGWQKTYVSYATSKLAAFGISPTNADWLALLALQTGWKAKYAAGNRYADRTHGQVIDKQTNRTVYERALRLFNRRYIANNAALTNEDRAGFGITIPGAGRTRPPAPRHAPSGAVRHILHLLHELRIVDPKAPNTRAKPKGVRTTRIYMCIDDGTTAPANEHFEMTGDTSTFEYKVLFKLADVGKTAHYYLVYENTHGETGPGSEVFSAVIA